MSLNGNMLLIFSIGFFATCIVLMLHLLFSSLNHDNRKAIFSYILIYRNHI